MWWQCQGYQDFYQHEQDNTSPGQRRVDATPVGCMQLCIFIESALRKWHSQRKLLVSPGTRARESRTSYNCYESSPGLRCILYSGSECLKTVRITIQFFTNGFTFNYHMQIRPNKTYYPEMFSRQSAELGVDEEKLLLNAAKNEYESFQLAANGGNDGVTIADIIVQVHDPAPQNRGGSILATVHRQHYINITTVSDCDGGFGMWPDALIPAHDVFYKEKRNAFPATAPKNGNQAFCMFCI